MYRNWRLTLLLAALIVSVRIRCRADLYPGPPGSEAGGREEEGRLSGGTAPPTDLIDSTRLAEQRRCPPNDAACEADQIGFEAICSLHHQIDDDNSGDLDREESEEFIRDDLKHPTSSVSSRKTDLHGSDDLLSVHDLWRLWTKSEVYGWDVDQVLEWLTLSVELPQYGDVFQANRVTGKLLPRLASSSQSFAASIGIKNFVHKQKLMIKATDVVLFGPPKLRHNYVKDGALVTSLLVALCGGYYAYVQQRRSQTHLNKVLHDLSALQSAEDQLRDLQDKLETARLEQARVDSDKRDLERTLRAEIDNAKAEAERLKMQRETSDEQLSSLKQADDELIQVRQALLDAERQLEGRPSLAASLPELQQWLQLTYETETRYFDAKREATDKQLRLAKDMCEKIRSQKGKFLSTFRMAHTSSIDDTDKIILSVRAALEDIKADLQERTQRWKVIEQICGFTIVPAHPGGAGHPLHSLGGSTLLFRESSPSLSSVLFTGDGASGVQHARNLSRHVGLDACDDDMPPLLLAQAMSGAGPHPTDALRTRPSASLLSHRSTGSLLGSPASAHSALVLAASAQTGSLAAGSRRGSKATRLGEGGEELVRNTAPQGEAVRNTAPQGEVVRGAASTQGEPPVLFDVGDDSESVSSDPSPPLTSLPPLTSRPLPNGGPSSRNGHAAPLSDPTGRRGNVLADQSDGSMESLNRSSTLGSSHNPVETDESGALEKKHKKSPFAKLLGGSKSKNKNS